METEFYLVKLDFRPEIAGAGSMTLQLAVNPKRGTLNGRAEGLMRLGILQGSHFSANASGNLYKTGLKSMTRVVGMEGRATVSVPPPETGCYLTTFKASFAIDDDWNGVGSFAAGANIYDCHVTRAG
ncbi:DUF1842 domain-containing protein [Imhoffiella purpurea]|nr:DUF1842 domain-containing protein [Imhoffiella purpurea]